MRLDEELDQRIKRELEAQIEPSAGFEAQLFSAAEDLLSTRRIGMSKRAGIRLPALPSWSAGDVLIWIARPVPQLVAIAALLLAAFGLFGLPRGPARPTLTFADLPSLPKFNEEPAKYDAQWSAENQNYEKEVEDEHLKTSGGG